MLDLTGRVIFLDSAEDSQAVWQLGYLDPNTVTAQSLRLLSDNEGQVLISPNFGYRWAYNIQYTCWMEIGWEDYTQLKPLQGNPRSQVTTAGLMYNDTAAMSMTRNNGTLEIFVEKLGQIRPNVTKVNKIDGTTINSSEAPFFIAVWYYTTNSWIGVKTDQMICRPDKTITNVSQLLLDGYMNYSSTRSAYQDIIIVDDYQLKYSNSLLIGLPNRNIDGLKYMPGTCVVKINYNNSTINKSLFGHYYQSYSSWNAA